MVSAYLVFLEANQPTHTNPKYKDLPTNKKVFPVGLRSPNRTSSGLQGPRTISASLGNTKGTKTNNHTELRIRCKPTSQYLGVSPSFNPVFNHFFYPTAFIFFFLLLLSPIFYSLLPGFTALVGLLCSTRVPDLLPYPTPMETQAHTHIRAHTHTCTPHMHPHTDHQLPTHTTHLHSPTSPKHISKSYRQFTTKPSSPTPSPPTPHQQAWSDR